MLDITKVTIRDVKTGYFRFNRKFVQKYRRYFKSQGVDITAPIRDEHIIRQLIAKAIVSNMSDEQCNILAIALDLLQDEEPH